VKKPLTAETGVKKTLRILGVLCVLCGKTTNASAVISVQMWSRACTVNSATDGCVKEMRIQPTATWEA
jgi:hypothetical protein